MSHDVINQHVEGGVSIKENQHVVMVIQLVELVYIMEYYHIEAGVCIKDNQHVVLEVIHDQ